MMNAYIAVGVTLVFGAGINRWSPWTPGGKPEFRVKRAAERPDLYGNGDRAVWRAANELHVSHFLTGMEGRTAGDFRPETRVRAVYDAAGLYLLFQVNDRYVRCIETQYHGKVWEDACVEFFVQPKPDRGYFNFEINCGGTLLLSYHENPEWKGEIRHRDGAVPWELAKEVVIHHSMPKTVEPEIATETTWRIAYHIPFQLLEEYVGPLGNPAGQTWRANFYKCAETNSHPHWASWSPIVEGDTFHTPRYFGLLRFE